MIEQHCQNPHPKFPGRECNTLQEINLSGEMGEGVIQVRCRRCKGWINFHLKAAVGTEA